uniref:SHR-BD domain-containing protein n=1 Tax=Macrostomum lignano TaxID=282301 RepID=A0A1I8FQP7_9PLAT
SVESISHRLVARPDLRSLSQVAGPAFCPAARVSPSQWPTRCPTGAPASSWSVSAVAASSPASFLSVSGLLKVYRVRAVLGRATQRLYGPASAIIARAAYAATGSRRRQRSPRRPSTPGRSQRVRNALVAWDPPGFELEFHVLHETRPASCSSWFADVGTRVKSSAFCARNSPTKARPVQRRQAQLASRRCHALNSAISNLSWLPKADAEAGCGR